MFQWDDENSPDGMIFVPICQGFGMILGRFSCFLINIFSCGKIIIAMICNDLLCFSGFFGTKQLNGLTMLNSTALRIRCWTVLRRGNGQGVLRADRC